MFYKLRKDRHFFGLLKIIGKVFLIKNFVFALLLLFWQNISIFVARMRIKLAILSLLLLTFSPLSAQRVATGERAPKITEYNIKQVQSQYICLIFIHSASQACNSAVKQALMSIDEQHSITPVLFTREAEMSLSNWLLALRAQGVMVVSQSSSLFSRYAIDYAPFAVIMDTRRRVVWFGNPQTLNSQRLDKILSQWTLQR